MLDKLKRTWRILTGVGFQYSDNKLPKYSVYTPTTHIHRRECGKDGGVHVDGLCGACEIERLRKLLEQPLYCDIHETKLQTGAPHHVVPCEWCLREARLDKLTLKWQPWIPGYEQRLNEKGGLETRPIGEGEAQPEQKQYNSEPCQGSYTEKE